MLCHKCLRKFINTMGGAYGARCPVCRLCVSEEDVSLASMGLPSEKPREDEEAPISLLNNYGEIVKKFNGIQQNLRRLKDESVQSRSMGMTYTNTTCHLCRQSHPTLRVIQVSQVGQRCLVMMIKDDNVQSGSMGMTYTNTMCHLCRESHPTLRVRLSSDV